MRRQIDKMPPAGVEIVETARGERLAELGAG